MDDCNRRDCDGDIRAALLRIIDSADFDASERNRNFLEYIVAETLAGRSERIKAYSVATSVFGREDTFDAQLDPIVRIEASRLRRSLERYYLTAGSEDRIRITIPKGGYVPAFEHADGNIELAGTPRLEDAPDEPAAAPVSAWRRARLRQGSAVLGVLAVVWLAAAWFGSFQPFAVPADQAPPQRQGPAIFVAPFDKEGDLSEFPNLDRGLTRDVIVALTRFSDLFVFGPETSYRYQQARNTRSATDALGVDYILTGTLAIDGDRFTVNAFLVEERSGEFLWSARFEEPLVVENIVRTRDRIANQIAQVLAQPYGVIFTQKARESDGKLPASLTSYDCMIRFYQYWRTFDRISYPSVRGCLENAIVADPYHAEAFAALALTYMDGLRFEFDTTAPADDLLRKATSLARHAIELEPGCTRGYHALLLAYWLGNDVERAFEAARAGLAINRNDTSLKADLGMYYTWRNRREEGLRLLHEAYAQNPGHPSVNRLAIAVDHYLNGRYREALAEAKLIDTPFLVYGYAAEAMAAARLGLDEQASAAIEKLLAINPGFGDQFVEHLERRNIHPDMIPILADGLRLAGLHIPEAPPSGD